MSVPASFAVQRFCANFKPTNISEIGISAKYDLSLSNDLINIIKLNIRKSTIKADKAGFVANMNLEKGEVVRQGQKLFVVVQQEKIYVEANFKETQMIFGIDLHTGLGKSGYDTILISDQIGEADYELLQNLYGSHIAPLDPNKGVGYHVTGDIHSGISSEFPSIKWLTITQEFGTYGPVTVFKNLRAENRWTQNNKLNDPLDIMKHWSRNNLLRTFNPDSRKWHESLIVRGKIVFNRAVEYLISID